MAFFSPFTNHRYFFPWRPIEVSPIGRVDPVVLAKEVVTVWLPCVLIALSASVWRELRNSPRR